MKPAAFFFDCGTVCLRAQIHLPSNLVFGAMGAKPLVFIVVGLPFVELHNGKRYFGNGFSISLNMDALLGVFV